MEGILLVDKPLGFTSFDVIAKLRKHLNVQKIGHTGTLDPLATGLLVVLVGRKFTRLADTLQSDEKEYLAQITLGKETTTYDREGEVIAESQIAPGKEAVEQAIKTFQGKSMQLPPMFSAKKIQGQKLYDLARQGKEVERASVEVSLQLKIIEYRYPDLLVHIICSKGTYVRSFAHDLGQKLGTYAHLANLRRLRCGAFLLKNSISLDALLQRQKADIPFVSEEIYESV